MMAVVAAPTLVDPCLLLGGVAVEPCFRWQPMWFRLVVAHFIIDGTYLAATARSDLNQP
jgi:hypothetical protein